MHGNNLQIAGVSMAEVHSQKSIFGARMEQIEECYCHWKTTFKYFEIQCLPQWSQADQSKSSWRCASSILFCEICSWPHETIGPRDPSKFWQWNQQIKGRCNNRCCRCRGTQIKRWVVDCPFDFWAIKRAIVEALTANLSLFEVVDTQL